MAWAEGLGQCPRTWPWPKVTCLTQAAGAGRAEGENFGMPKSGQIGHIRSDRGPVDAVRARLRHAEVVAKGNDLEDL